MGINFLRYTKSFVFLGLYNGSMDLTAYLEGKKKITRHRKMKKIYINEEVNDWLVNFRLEGKQIEKIPRNKKL